MEDEAFSLFVMYRREEQPAYVASDGRGVSETLPIIRRVTLQKQHGKMVGDFESKRVNVDFDPIVEKTAFVVTIHAKVENPVSLCVSDFYFPAIVQTLEEAEEVVKRVEEGEYKNFLDKDREEKFHKVTIHPVVITNT